MQMTGLFFSMMTIALVSLLLIYAYNYLDALAEQGRQSAITVRAIELGNFADSIGLDFPRVLEISAKRSLYAAVDYIDTNGVALDDAHLRLVELIKNGTIYGSQPNLTSSSAFPAWISTVESLGNKYGFGTNISFDYLNISQKDPFTLAFSGRLSVNITDKSGMNITRAYNETIYVSLVDFEDPVYPLNTNGFVRRQIAPAPTNIYGGSSLDEGVANGYYSPTTDGAGYLDRMEGRLTPSGKYGSNGMESFVYLPSLAVVGLIVKQNTSVVDHYYFDSITYAGWDVTGSAYTWLQLDCVHAAWYGVTLAGSPC